MVRFWNTRSAKLAGVNTDSEGHLLSFSTPTHAHVSDTHGHSYDHFGTAMCGGNGLLEIGFADGLKLLAWLRTAVRLQLLNLLLRLVD
jgi:hypothetical protein